MAAENGVLAAAAQLNEEHGVVLALRWCRFLPQTASGSAGHVVEWNWLFSSCTCLVNGTCDLFAAYGNLKLVRGLIHEDC